MLYNTYILDSRKVIDIPLAVDIPTHLEKASPERIKEYHLGRYAGYLAGQKYSDNIIAGFNEDRSPLWPSGIVGSISHKHHFYVASVAKACAIKSIGIDIEKIIDNSRFKSVERLVLTASDFDFVEATNIEKSFLYTLIFSAKESLYKLIYPLAKVYFDFREANFIYLDTDKCEFELEIISEKDELKIIRKKYKGQYEIIENDYILTSMYLIV